MKHTCVYETYIVCMKHTLYFIKRYTVERTNKAEKGPEEQSEKAESCRENLLNEMQLKGP